MIRFFLALLNLLRLLKKHPPAEVVHEQVTGVDAAPPAAKPKQRVVVKTKKPVKEPWLRQPGETAAEWLERTTKTR